MTRLSLTGLAISIILAACTIESTVEDDDGGSEGAGGSGGNSSQPQGLPVLGNYEHTVGSVEILSIGTAADGLLTPRDLEFNPQNPAELWVATRDNDSVVVITNPGLPEQFVTHNSGFGSQHFLPEPSALAMGADGFFATIHETDEQTQGINGTPADFMGPTLWRHDIVEFEGGEESHWDMLHNSPNGMGIAWQYGNVYWVFDGFHSSITKYDFVLDHGPGGTDHSDAVVRRCVEGEVAWVENVPSHMQFDPPGGTLLYISDTGNSRVAVLDTATGMQGESIYPNYDYSDQKVINDAVLTTLVDGNAIDPPMTTPSGLAIYGGHIFVSDNASSTIFAFDMQGQLVDWLVLDILPAGSVMGLTFDAQGQLYIADGLGETVHRITARAE